VLKGSQPLKGFITRVEEAVVSCDEPRQIVLRLGACEAARFTQKVDGRTPYCFEERLTSVCEPACRVSCHLIDRSMQLIDVHPSIPDKNCGQTRRTLLGMTIRVTRKRGYQKLPFMARACTLVAMLAARAIASNTAVRWLQEPCPFWRVLKRAAIRRRYTPGEEFSPTEGEHSARIPARA
jgi:hypothetical protein